MTANPQNRVTRANNPGIASQFKQSIWKIFYSRWHGRHTHMPGYTILLMVPGDLPVFLRLAVHVCRMLDQTHLVETLVIPDQPSPAFDRSFAQVKQDWQNGMLRLVKLRPLDRLITRMNSPHTNHWLQLVNGISRACSTHVLLHDADLFITNKSLFREHYEQCASRNLACLGIGEVWDPWYRENGFGHLTGTWEMMASLDWLYAFKPYQLHGHKGVIDRKVHTFDTLLLPQCLTPSDRIDFKGPKPDCIHFNYVICTYRWFQQCKGPFEDEHFRIFLIRLLIEVYDQSDWPYQVPCIEELVAALHGRSNRITYEAEQTRRNYIEFSHKLHRLLESGLLDARQIEILQTAVRPFDEVMLDRSRSRDAPTGGRGSPRAHPPKSMAQRELPRDFRFAATSPSDYS